MNSFIVGFIFVFIVYLTGLILVVRWMYCDAKMRDMNPWGWILITCLFSPNFIGLILYLLFRRKDTEIRCIECGKQISEYYQYCPWCGKPNVQDVKPKVSLPHQKLLTTGIICMIISVLGALVVYMIQLNYFK